MAGSVQRRKDGRARRVVLRRGRIRATARARPDPGSTGDRRVLPGGPRLRRHALRARTRGRDTRERSTSFAPMAQLGLALAGGLSTAAEAVQEAHAHLDLFGAN